MKICKRCNNTVNDNEEFCGRCGGRNFMPAGQAPQQRPQQGQPMQRHQQRHQQGQSMQRPQQGQPMQRPQQGQPMQRPQQRPQQMNQNMGYDNSYGQNQNMAFDNGYGQNQNMGYDNGFGQSDMFPEEPVPKKKGLFGKKPKQPVMNQGNTYENNGFGPTVQSASEDGSSVVDWVKTLLILLIPVYGLVKYFLSMNDMSQPAYKRNFYKAFLIYFVTCAAISIVFSTIIGGLVGAAFAGLG